MASSIDSAVNLQSIRAANDMCSIKAVAEAAKLLSAIPSTYNSLTVTATDSSEKQMVDEELSHQIPVIDLTLLLSQDPHIHAKAVQHLAKACEEWGFFMVINHGIPERVIKDVINLSEEFHNLPDEEKAEFGDDKGPSNPIRCGTSFNYKVEEVHCWRDYLKVITHPQWAFPNKPQGFNDVAKEYCRETRRVAGKLLEGLSESLDLKPDAIAKATGFGNGFQVFVANLYPPCPQPELARGLPAHIDLGFLDFIIQNGVCGLQISHKGKWVNVNPVPNSILVNTAAQLEVASNGRYKSVLHRAVLNNKETRISIVTAIGPDMEKEVKPMEKLIEKEEALYRGMKFKDYYKLQQTNRLDGKTCIDHVRIKPRA